MIWRPGWDIFWLTGEQWTVIEPHMPENQPGARRADDLTTAPLSRASSTC